MNPNQVSKIVLTPEVIDCIVFWTKNPQPMMERLDELEAYKYYFQFTLTSYGQDIEKNIPHKRDSMIPIFQRLSAKIGSERVIWRYDPIIFTDKYTEEYHLNAFEQIATALKGYTRKCVISFVDTYAKNRKAMQSLNQQEKSLEEIKVFSCKLSEIAKKNQMQIAACAESMDLSDCGIGHNSCIDKQLIEQIIGCKLKLNKDKNQRPECGCVESIEVGTYNTCQNGCIYCYANHSQESVMRNCKSYDVNAPILCGRIADDDNITERKMCSLKDGQLDIFSIE